MTLKILQFWEKTSVVLSLLPYLANTRIVTIHLTPAFIIEQCQRCQIQEKPKIHSFSSKYVLENDKSCLYAYDLYLKDSSWITKSILMSECTVDTIRNSWSCRSCILSTVSNIEFIWEKEPKMWQNLHQVLKLFKLFNKRSFCLMKKSIHWFVPKGLSSRTIGFLSSDRGRKLGNPYLPDRSIWHRIRTASFI